MLQLVSPSVRVEMHSYIQRERVYDQQAVRERYGGLSPERQPDVKGLQGDTSDNIPGVPGIGAKTAVKLIVQFGSLEALYERLDEVTPPRIQELLGTHRDQAFLGKELTTIVRDAPVELDTEASRFGDFDRESVLAVLRELEFSSMVGRIPQASGQQELGQGQMALPLAQTARRRRATPCRLSKPCPKTSQTTVRWTPARPWRPWSVSCAPMAHSPSTPSPPDRTP